MYVASQKSTIHNEHTHTHPHRSIKKSEPLM